MRDSKLEKKQRRSMIAAKSEKEKVTNAAGR
jgi:hypothetical protein